MPLRVNLSHALGSRVEQFDDRGIDRPLVVGRGAEADLQIPSVQVSSTHCVLFVHEGRWVVQDAGSRAGTFLNGQPIRTPMPVHDGDEVTLGPAETNPPKLLLVETSAATSGASEEPASHGGTGWLPPSADVAGPATTPAAPVATADFYAADPEPTFPSYATASRRRRVKRDSNAPVIVTMVVLAVAFAIVATIVIAEKRKQALAPLKPPETVTVVTGGSGGGGRGSILFSDPAAPTPAPTPRPPPPRPTSPPDPVPSSPANVPSDPSPAPPSTPAGAPGSAPSSPATPPASDTDPRREDPDWVRVDEAHRMSSPGEALAIFIDYQQRFPDSPFRNEVQGYIDEALDRLWFARMKQLIDQRDELEKRKTGMERHLREVQRSGAADRQRVAEMTGQVKELESRIAEVNKELQGDMGHDGTPLDPYNDSQVAALRAKRDKAKYDRWTKWVLGSIRRTRGALPW